MKKTRRILAIIGIVLLLGMYLTCFILALTGRHQATDLFRAALGATIAVPIMLYAFLMLLKLFPPFVKSESGIGEGEPKDAGTETDDEADTASADEEASSGNEP